MKILFLAVALLGCVYCGSERWPQKTMSDSGSSQIIFKPVSTTVSHLVSLPAPYRPTDRVAPTETTLFDVKAKLIGYKVENDRDIHLVIADLKTGQTMVAEIPDPQCQGACKYPWFLGKYAAARDVINALGVPGPRFVRVDNECADVRGVGFFDKLHGQTGVASNGIELHPVLRIAVGACQ